MLLLFYLWMLSVLHATFGDTLAKKPNIVFIVAEDLGWDDPGFHGSPQIPTPTMNDLSNSGILLNSYYISPSSFATKCEIMTGKYAAKLGVQHGVFHNKQPAGLPEGEKILPEYMKELGYSTHAVGKWGLGFYKKSYLPWNRGFNTFYGGLTSSTIDYFTHSGYDDNYGLDLRRNEQVVYNETGKYATELYTKQAVEVINNMENDKPFFLYVSHQAVHSGNAGDPLQVPNRYLENLSYIRNPKRKLFAGMVSALDESLLNISIALSDKGLMDNTIIIFTSVSGAAVGGMELSSGSNYPLRGSKLTVWEGGVRGVGFVYSDLIVQNSFVNEEMFHSTDWLPTILNLAGGDATDLKDLDGFNIWDPLTKRDTISPRFEILHQFDPIQKNQCALRVGDYKIIINQDIGYYGDWYPRPAEVGELQNLSEPENLLPKAKLRCDKNYPHPFLEMHAPPCDPMRNPCLFNIEWDPCEFHNLAAFMPNTLRVLRERLIYYHKLIKNPNYPKMDKNADPENNEGVWGPWNSGDENTTVYSVNKTAEHQPIFTNNGGSQEKFGNYTILQPLTSKNVTIIDQNSTGHFSKQASSNTTENVQPSKTLPVQSDRYPSVLVPGTASPPTTVILNETYETVFNHTDTPIIITLPPDLPSTTPENEKPQDSTALLQINNTITYPQDLYPNMTSLLSTKTATTQPNATDTTNQRETVGGAAESTLPQGNETQQSGDNLYVLIKNKSFNQTTNQESGSVTNSSITESDLGTDVAAQSHLINGKLVEPQNKTVQVTTLNSKDAQVNKEESLNTHTLSDDKLLVSGVDTSTVAKQDTTIIQTGSSSTPLASPLANSSSTIPLNNETTGKGKHTLLAPYEEAKAEGNVLVKGKNVKNGDGYVNSVAKAGGNSLTHLNKFKEGDQNSIVIFNGKVKPGPPGPTTKPPSHSNPTNKSTTPFKQTTLRAPPPLIKTKAPTTPTTTTPNLNTTPIRTTAKTTSTLKTPPPLSTTEAPTTPTTMAPALSTTSTLLRSPPPLSTTSVLLQPNTSALGFVKNTSSENSVPSLLNSFKGSSPIGLGPFKKIKSGALDNLEHPSLDTSAHQFEDGWKETGGPGVFVNVSNDLKDMKQIPPTTASIKPTEQKEENMGTNAGSATTSEASAGGASKIDSDVSSIKDPYYYAALDNIADAGDKGKNGMNSTVTMTSGGKINSKEMPKAEEFIQPLQNIEVKQPDMEVPVNNVVNPFSNQTLKSASEMGAGAGAGAGAGSESETIVGSLSDTMSSLKGGKTEDNKENNKDGKQRNLYGPTQPTIEQQFGSDAVTKTVEGSPESSTKQSIGIVNSTSIGSGKNKDPFFMITENMNSGTSTNTSAGSTSESQVGSFGQAGSNSSAGSSGSNLNTQNTNVTTPLSNRTESSVQFDVKKLMNSVNGLPMLTTSNDKSPTLDLHQPSAINHRPFQSVTDLISDSSSQLCAEGRDCINKQSVDLNTILSGSNRTGEISNGTEATSNYTSLTDDSNYKRGNDNNTHNHAFKAQVWMDKKKFYIVGTASEIDNQTFPEDANTVSPSSNIPESVVEMPAVKYSDNKGTESVVPKLGMKKQNIGFNVMLPSSIIKQVTGNAQPGKEQAVPSKQSSMKDSVDHLSIRHPKPKSVIRKVLDMITDPARTRKTKVPDVPESVSTAIREPDTFSNLGNFKEGQSGDIGAVNGAEKPVSRDTVMESEVPIKSAQNDSEFDVTSSVNPVNSSPASSSSTPHTENAGDLGSIVTLVGKAKQDRLTAKRMRQNGTSTLNDETNGDKKSTTKSEHLVSKHTQQNATSTETNAAKVNPVVGPSNSVIVSSVIVVLIAAFVVIGMAVVAVVAVVARQCNFSKQLQTGS